MPTWPLIWLQVLVLRAYVRATYGPGTPYHWSVTLCGRAYITSIDPACKSPPDWLVPKSDFEKRLAAACEPLSPGRGVGVRRLGLSIRSRLCVEAPAFLISLRKRALPLPET
ncbi:MAG: hypothetical protein R3C04_08635 [Hyphomonas sp.]